MLSSKKYQVWDDIFEIVFCLQQKKYFKFKDIRAIKAIDLVFSGI